MSLIRIYYLRKKASVMPARKTNRKIVRHLFECKNAEGLKIMQFEKPFNKSGLNGTKRTV